MRSFWLLGALCLFAASSAAQEIGKVRFLAGQVTVSRAGAISNAAAGDNLRANDIVRTGPAPGNGARIILLDASELTLGPGTELRVVVHNPDTQQTTIEMLHGHLRAKVTPVVKPGGIFQVRTPTAIAVALGTVMQVDTVETTTATVADAASQRQIEDLPVSGRNPADLIAVLPGTASPATTDRIRGLANNSILDGNSDSASVTGSLTFPPSEDAISSLSVTSLYTGVVSDAVSNSSGQFETSPLPSGPYNIRISLKNGSNSYQAHAFELYGGTHINFFNTPPGGQPSASARSGWDFSIAPSYDLESPRSSAILQRRFPTLPSFSAYPPPSGMSFPSGGEVAVGGSSGASNFFNPQTQTYNALTPFTVSNPFVATGNRNLDSNYSNRTGNRYSIYSSASAWDAPVVRRAILDSELSLLRDRGIGLFGPRPIFLPRFGQGSDFGNGRSSTPNFFFPPATSPAPGASAPTVDIPYGSSFTGRGTKLGLNYTFDPNFARSNQFSYVSSPQFTTSHDYIASLGGMTLGTDFSPSFQSPTRTPSETMVPSRWFSRPPPITDPRISYFALGMFGWWPVGPNGHAYSVEEIDSLHIGAPSPAIQIGGLGSGLMNSSPDYSGILNGRFNLNQRLDFNFTTGVSQGAFPRPEYDRFQDSRTNDENWNVRRNLQLNFGTRYSSSYIPGNTGDDIAAQLENPTISSRLLRSIYPRTSKYGDEYRLPVRERFSEPYISFHKYSKYPSYAFTEVPDKSLSYRSKHSAYELELSPRVTRAMIGETGYKYSDSWCSSRSYKYDKYDRYRLWPSDYLRPKEFYGALYGYKQPIAPAFARSLDDIQPGLTQRVSGRFGMWDYPGVTVTIVIALDHWVAVAGYATGTRTQYAQSGHMIIVRANQAAERSVAVMNFNGTVPTFQQASLKNFPTGESLFRAVPEFNATGTCVATYLLNGVVLFGGSPTAVTYKMLGTGSSTGQVIRVLVTNNTNCAVYFMVSFGAVLQPHSLEHKIGAAISLLLGSNLNFNNIKSYQIMINFGGTTIAIIVVPPSSPPPHPADMGGHVEADAGSSAESAAEQLPPNVVEGFLRSYCLELHKLAPYPETRYDFADAKLQDELGPNATFLQHIFELVQSGALKIPSGHSMDSLIQWTLWASREGMDQSKFMDAYMTRVHINYDGQQRKWDKDAQKQTEESGKTLWTAVAMALAAK